MTKIMFPAKFLTFRFLGKGCRALGFKAVISVVFLQLPYK